MNANNDEENRDIELAGFDGFDDWEPGSFAFSSKDWGGRGGGS